MGKFTEYKLPLRSLSQGTHEFDFHLTKTFFTNMESEDVHDADLDVKCTVTLRGDVYELRIDIPGTVTLICDRCLDDLEFPIDTTYDINVKYGDEYNDASDTLLVIPQSDNFLNVAYMIYDTVVLAIPIKHVHPMGKCNRAMSAMLRKHRVAGSRPAGDDSEDAAIEEKLIDEMEDMDASAPRQTDPRWDGLKGLASGASDSDTDND